MKNSSSLNVQIRKRRHGFLKRLKTKSGRNIIQARIQKKRTLLSK